MGKYVFFLGLHYAFAAALINMLDMTFQDAANLRGQIGLTIAGMSGSIGLCLALGFILWLEPTKKLRGYADLAIFGLLLGVVTVALGLLILSLSVVITQTMWGDLPIAAIRGFVGFILMWIFAFLVVGIKNKVKELIKPLNH